VNSGQSPAKRRALGGRIGVAGKPRPRPGGDDQVSRPLRDSSRRTARISGRFMSSRCTVARPVGLDPTIVMPSHRKCLNQCWRRGWKRETFLPVNGSRADRRADLRSEQKTQTGYTRRFVLSILGVAPNNRRSGAPEVGRLEPTAPGTTQAGRIIMRDRPASPVPPRAHWSRPGVSC